MTDTVAHVRPAFGVTDLLLFTMAVIWGINFSVVKYATLSFSPPALTGLRVALAALFLIGVAFAGARPQLARRDVLILLLLGVLGNGLYQLFFIHGVRSEEHTSE